ncbi:MAG: tRNA (guanosine(37)-N1)-methyltransferase TrmD [Chlamydiales bacterium]|nr:tRNA (guanosine(37)-N1)-methyltransferase TrmD [Chlamydiales bacterium]
MQIDILSLFPGYFKGPFDESIIKRAREQMLLKINLVDLREFATDKHKRVDDRPYGGGPGMVLMPGPVVDAIRSLKKASKVKPRVIYLSPQGAVLNAARSRALAKEEHIILLCGHYEGVDERALFLEVDEEISIGDYVLTNGCLPAIVLVDAIARFVPGVLGCEDAAAEDSFEAGIFDCPHFTRPPIYASIDKDLEVPEVLLSGNHERVRKWRYSESLAKTYVVRPDLFTCHLFGESKSKLENRGLFPYLVVKNLRASIKFYSEQLGLRLEQKNEQEAVLEFTSCEEKVVSRIGLVEASSADERTSFLSCMKMVFTDPKEFNSFTGRLRSKKSCTKRSPNLVIAEKEITFVDLDGHIWYAVLAGN